MRATPFLGLTAIGSVALLLVAPAANASPGQTVYDLTTLTVQQLVDSLPGLGATSNATFVGAPQSAGSFSGMSVVGFDSGVVLSTGAATGIVGPNDSQGQETEFATAGDSDLDLLVAPEVTTDAAVLEFDFVPTTPTISLQFVFGSDEYQESVGDQFDDVVALYINGVNCAVVPTGVGDTPISINRVNATQTPAAYRDNDEDAGTPFDVQFDGLTVPLTCTAAVEPGEVSHFKLAIADAADESVNSAVMIEGLAATPIIAPVAVVTPTLAATGTDSYGILGAGALAVAFGVVAIGLRRRRTV